MVDDWFAPPGAHDICATPLGLEQIMCVCVCQYARDDELGGFGRQTEQQNGPSRSGCVPIVS